MRKLLILFLRLMIGLCVFNISQPIPLNAKVHVFQLLCHLIFIRQTMHTKELQLKEAVVAVAAANHRQQEVQKAKIIPF